MLIPIDYSPPGVLNEFEMKRVILTNLPINYLDEPHLFIAPPHLTCVLGPTQPHPPTTCTTWTAANNAFSSTHKKKSGKFQVKFILKYI